MSKIEDELIGQLVLVHPNLNGDPANKAGQVGVITGVELENDNVYVGFGKQGQGLYGTDAVLLLKNHHAVNEAMYLYGEDISGDDRTALFQISLLQQFPQSSANTKTAMSLAMKNETIRQHSMQTLENRLGRDIQAALYR